MTEEAVLKAISDGGVIVVLASLLIMFIRAYRQEVEDHKETLKEIANVRQKMKEVQSVVEAAKHTQTGI